MPGGIIISETEPSKENKYLWMQPLQDGSTKCYELVEDIWILKYTLPIPQSAIDASILIHKQDANSHHPANTGISGSKVVDGYRLTFTNGLLTGFERV